MGTTTIVFITLGVIGVILLIDLLIPNKKRKFRRIRRKIEKERKLQELELELELANMEEEILLKKREIILQKLAECLVDAELQNKETTTQKE